MICHGADTSRSWRSDPALTMQFTKGQSYRDGNGKLVKLECA